MKLALCTTTIHVPHALKLMRKCSPDVKFFVTGDHKTPREAYELVLSLGANSTICMPESGHKWKCSEAIGWNTLARRNIAFLEALKWGADVIYSWDDDNIPVQNTHFDLIQSCFQSWPYAGGDPRYNGIKVSSTTGWFDPGSLLIPTTRHRGIPWDNPTHSARKADPVTNARIGVAAGLVIGAGDADAVTQIEHKPDIGQVHILGSTGVVVDNHTWTAWNSQNTAMIRELVPSWFMGPSLGRHDDIFAALVVQRVMRERGYHVHFGPPFCLHERNEHDLLVDLRAEIDGMQNVRRMAELLDHVVLVGKNVIDDTRVIYYQLAHADWYPSQAVTAALAYLDDCESVLCP